MVQFVEDEPRLSNGSSCLFPPLMCMDSQPRRSLSYDKLPQKPLRLTVLKLDSSSFGIEVGKAGTVGDVKQAVEAAFGHLPKRGPGRVSWAHVWGQFCLCHEGHKLVNDSDYVGMFGIKDGDELQFIRHYSSSYNLVRTQSEKDDPYVDDEPSVSYGYREEVQNDEKNYFHHIEMEDFQSDHMELDNGPLSKCKASLSRLFRCWFSYSKLSSSQMRNEKRSSSYNKSGSFKNVIRFYNNQTNSRTETWKGK